MLGLLRVFVCIEPQSSKVTRYYKQHLSYFTRVDRPHVHKKEQTLLLRNNTQLSKEVLLCLFVVGKWPNNFLIGYNHLTLKGSYTIMMAAVLLPCVNVPVSRKSSTAILKQSFMLAPLVRASRRQVFVDSETLRWCLLTLHESTLPVKHRLGVV